jgi:two-component system LytT family response regulator
MKINCIAIEDEPLALLKITEFVRDVKYLNLVHVFDNALEALLYLKDNTIDLVFLDIQMKGLSGMAFLEALQSKPKIIITSAYDEYALKGYEFDITDYLLKPFTFERFLKSVDKAYNLLYNREKNIRTDYIFLKVENRLEKVELESILFIKGMIDYLQFVCAEKSIMTLLTFNEALELLPSENFQRVHLSYVVATSKIDNIERNRIRIGKDTIPISDSYKESFMKHLKQYKLLL